MKRDAEHVHHDFVDAEIDALVKHRVVGRSSEKVGQHVLDGDERRADEKDDETAKKQDVAQRWPTAEC